MKFTVKFTVTVVRPPVWFAMHCVSHLGMRTREWDLREEEERCTRHCVSLPFTWECEWWCESVTPLLRLR